MTCGSWGGGQAGGSCEDGNISQRRFQPVERAVLDQTAQTHWRTKVPEFSMCVPISVLCQCICASHCECVSMSVCQCVCVSVRVGLCVSVNTRVCLCARMCVEVTGAENSCPRLVSSWSVDFPVRLHLPEG